ncbi:MAG: U32 family peptidase [Victivallaceae bacterium]|nr:U32 family peptidase [Victivallaceae bacterium]
MKEKTKKIPELLAPAGNLLAGITAFEAGADAVYAGLSKFNARERGENFSFNDMSRLVAYARHHSRKVYVTLNTLIKERELPEIVEFLAELGRFRPDAVIVQDLGVLRIVREYFSGMEIHASTQMGFHNSAGLQVAARLGVKRVILERQVTLEELKIIRANSPVELEIFVHGALCCSLSGQCLFSSWLGGWSGNRGKCKQPCRRRFYGAEGNGFFFSTQDLSTLELVHEFKQLGIAALKIEGRLRKPDYVRNAVAAYRLLLDAEGLPGRKLLGEARKILSGTYGRKWSHGFYSEQSFKTLIKHETPGAAGLLCGRAEFSDARGFAFKTAHRLCLGDRLRIQPETGDEGPALTVTRMAVNGNFSPKAAPGQECYIFCDKAVPLHGLVYKIGEDYADRTVKPANLPELRSALDLQLTVSSTEIRVELFNADGLVWKRALLTRPARTQALTPARVVSEFTASGSKKLRAGNIQVDIDGAYFVPASELKQARRAFWDWAAANVDLAAVFSDNVAALETFRKDYLAIGKTGIDAAALPETIALGRRSRLPANRKAIKAHSIFEMNRLTDEVILPAFCPEPYLAGLRNMIDDAYGRKIRRFRITGLYALELLKDYPEVRISAGFPLPVCNSLAVQELAALGLSAVQGWIELERAALTELAGKAVLPVEIYRYGRPPLLSTRAYIAVKGEVKDARDQRFVVQEDRHTHIASVYPRKVFSIPRLPGAADYYDLTHADWNAGELDSFNFDRMLM